MHLFGKKKKESAAAASDPAAAITKLKESESVLTKRKDVMQHKVNEELKTIKRLMGTKKEADKKAAMMCLRRKKMYEKNVDDLDKMAMNLQTQIFTLENAKMNVEMFKAQQVATSGLKHIHGDMDIDKVEEMQMDLQEQLELAGEIQGALANPIAGQDIDDDELLEELEGLEQEDMDAALADVGPETELEALPAMPSAPSGLPTIAVPAAAAAMTDEERELMELEASMQ